MPVRFPRRISIPILLALFLLPLRSSAEEAATWKAVPLKTAVKAGESFPVKIIATINSGWHVYSTRDMGEGPVSTSFSILSGKNFSLAGKPKQPKPITRFDDAFQINTEYYEKSVTFTQNVMVKAGVKPGRYDVDLGINFMACNDRLCLPPKTVKASFTITVEEGSAPQTGAIPDTAAPASAGQAAADSAAQAGAVPSKSAAPPQQASQEKSGLASGDAADVERAKQKGFWAYIGLAMSVGALALLTPCVFPMIPITVSFFTKRPTISRGRGILDASIYSLGIIFTFTCLGLLLAVTLGAAGINEFAANPMINILIAAIFIVFAFNLFGMFEIIVPSGILTKLTAKSQEGSGILSLLLMGLTFTLTSFTCTVPFVGTILVAASQGDYWWSILGMLAFSTAFAFPFFLLALFPSWLKSLPHSGAWLNSVKVVMGFLELAAAMKFLSNVDLVWSLGILNRDLFLAIWIAIFIITAIYLLGKIRLPHDTPLETIGVMRMIWAIFFIGISVYLYTGLNNRPLGELDAFLPPMLYQQTIEAAAGGPTQSDAGSGKEERWITDYNTALDRSRKEGKPVFIDFTGFACTNCRWMEANVFTRSDIRGLLKNYILARLYTDGQGEAYQKNRSLQEQRFGTVALPLYVVLDPQSRELARFPGLTRRPEEFRQFLEQGLSAFKGSRNNS